MPPFRPKLLPLALCGLCLLLTTPGRADDVVTHVRNANAAAQKGDWDTALKELDAVLALDPKNIEGHAGRAIVLSRKQDYKGAISELDKVIELNPKFAAAYQNRAALHNQTGDKQKAQGDYVMFIRLSPDAQKQLRAQAKAAADKGESQQAVNGWSVLALALPDDAEAQYGRGKALRELYPTVAIAGDADQVKRIIKDMRESFEAALKADPKYVPAYVDLAKTLDEGSREEALKVIERGVKAVPDSAALFLARADLQGIGFMVKDEALKPALADYTRALELDPKNVRALVGRGRAYRNLKQPDLAMKDLDEALKLDPDQADALNIRAQLFHSKGDHQREVGDYDHLFKLKPDSNSIEFSRFLALCHLDDPARALDAITELLKKTPDSALYLRLRAEQYLRKKDFAHASEDILKAKGIAPEDKQVLDLAAQIEKAKG